MVCPSSWTKLETKKNNSHRPTGSNKELVYQYLPLLLLFFTPTKHATHCVAHYFLLSIVFLLYTTTMSPLPGSVLLAPSPAGTKYDAMYYLKGAAAGGICCSITHGALCPVDVVKTRVQLDPVKVRSCGIGEVLLTKSNVKHNLQQLRNCWL